MNQSTKGIPKKGLPEGFLYVDEVIQDCIVDAKYAGTDNFMGRPAAGYEAPLVVVTKEAAQRLEKAAAVFRDKGYLMKFYDSYRPQRAVDDFMRWGADAADVEIDASRRDGSHNVEIILPAVGKRRLKVAGD